MVVTFQYGDTPLHTSARYGHAGVIRILVSGRCNVSEQNKVRTREDDEAVREIIEKPAGNNKYPGPISQLQQQGRSWLEPNSFRHSARFLTGLARAGPGGCCTRPMFLYRNVIISAQPLLTLHAVTGPSLGRN